MKATRTAIEQAELLADLAQKIAQRGHLWTREERKDARILCAILIDHSLAAERAQQVQEAVG